MKAVTSLAIVTPMANEIATAELFVQRVLQATANLETSELFTVFDNVCTDGTRGLLDDLALTEERLQVVWAPENRSVVDAYVRAYRAGLDSGFDWVLEIDAGLSHDPGAILTFLALAEEGFDCVFGSRFIPGGAMVQTPLNRRMLSWGGTVLANLILGSHLTDMTSGFQLFSREALDWILAEGIQSRGPFFQTEVKYHALRAFKVVLGADTQDPEPEPEAPSEAESAEEVAAEAAVLAEMETASAEHPAAADEPVPSS